MIIILLKSCNNSRCRCLSLHSLFLFENNGFDLHQWIFLGFMTLFIKLLNHFIDKYKTSTDINIQKSCEIFDVYPIHPHFKFGIWKKNIYYFFRFVIMEISTFDLALVLAIAYRCKQNSKQKQSKTSLF